MNRIFTLYGAAILLAFSVAAYKGYAVSSLFANQHHSTASQNHYYHK
jgi:hypothetical protein